jgi:hypothetical protein
MTKSKTDAKRKREKPETATKAERVKWDPAYCPKVEALGAEGKSAPEIRRALGIPASTWRAWVKKHPDFAEAVEEAADQAEALVDRPGSQRCAVGDQLLRADLHLPHEEHLPGPVP